MAKAATDITVAAAPQGPRLPARSVAEALGTGVLVVAIVGSGIAAERAFAAEPGLVLMVNALATGAVLIALIVAMFSISAAFNPVVTLLARLHRRVDTAEAGCLIGAQVIGALFGVLIANAMFDLAPVTVSSDDRVSSGVLLGEVVATIGLLIVIAATARTGDGLKVGIGVGAYISAAIWFTSSTAFANPAVTVARMLTDTFSGIAPASAAWFILAQLAGLALAAGAIRLLFPPATTRSSTRPPPPPATTSKPMSPHCCAASDSGS